MKSLWIWPFELEEKIGEGGMGVVYRGRYVKNDRRVAVKLLPEDVADDILLARFEREVEILKTLRHPNIVHSFGGVCEDKRRFYAMELVEGGTLDDLLRSRGGRLPWEQAVEIGLEICSALQYAHERGVVHRDIKPGNFLLTRDGHVKLSDFGLATVVSANKLTASGKTVGSFRYMAPEQVRGETPVPQTDLYSLGCLMFLMIAGRPPFDGTTAAELLKKQLEEPPPRLTILAPDCPVALERLILKLLEKPIENRPSSALEVAQALRAVTMTTTADVDAGNRASVKQAAINAFAPALQRVSTARPAPLWVRLALLGVAAFLIVACGYLWNENRRLKRAEQLWIEAFNKEGGSFEARNTASDALGELAADSGVALAALREGLESKNPRVRAAAVRGLGKAGAVAKPLLPRIVSLQRRDESDQVRVAAARSAAEIRAAEGSSSSLGSLLFFGALVLAVVGGGIFLWRRRGMEPADKPAAVPATPEPVRRQV